MAVEIYPGITADPALAHGRPVAAGTRALVEALVGALAGGSTREEVAEDYHLTSEQIRAALGYATRLLRS
jgi:uncharacterized protein (DUF433 family)